jgi:hypothetical protein
MELGAIYILKSSLVHATVDGFFVAIMYSNDELRSTMS